MARQLLLIGAGHAHLHLVKQAHRLFDAGYHVCLLAPPSFRYSGTASAVATGSLGPDAGSIDVRALAASSGVQLHEGILTGVEPGGRVAVTGDGRRVPFDVVSINIGSVADPPGVTIDASVLRVKPLDRLAALSNRLREVGPEGVVTVVGGGFSGIELAGHLSALESVRTVRLVESGPVIGPDLPEAARRRAERLLAARGVDVRTGLRAVEIGEREVNCSDGTRLEHHVAVLATGLRAPDVLAATGWGDADGVPVGPTLQHVDAPHVYAAGDCAHFFTFGEGAHFFTFGEGARLVSSPLPRIGVHGVRQGPVLLDSLLARQRGGPLPVYRPARHALSILDLGGGVALAVRGDRWWFGRSSLQLKRIIDRRWIRGYRVR